MFRVLFITLVVSLLHSTISHASNVQDLTLININKIGPKLLTEIKNHKKIEWWVEIGEKLIVALNDSNVQLPTHFEVIGNHKQVDISQLYFQSNGHCNHADTDKKDHAKLDVLFGNASFQLVNNSTNQKNILEHELITPFVKNKVLIYQYENREHVKRVKKFAEQLGELVSQVDKDRWFLSVEKLASYDRMTEVGLVEAGQWLEGKFQELGLTTSTIDLHNRRGFNVLGFKQGITKPDDWYVVGAHLDSRNQNWIDSQRSPGAEDNASGCAGVLEIATVLSQYDTEASIMFICFNAEERGLLGSGDVIEQFTNDGDIDKVKAMLNLDMISYRLGNRNVAVAATNNSTYQQLVDTIAANGNTFSDLDWQISLNGCCTDFRRFSDVQIPAATSNQPDISTYFGYHRLDDLPENVDPVLGAGIVKANLATLADFVGVDFNSNQAFLITAAQTGLWYNPDQSGHGLNIEILADNQIVAFWYTYDNDGNQIWLLGTGTYNGNTATLDVIITESGVFPPNFVADNVNLTDWGTFQFEFSGCDSGNFSWSPTDTENFIAGNLQLTRLTRIDGLDCQPVAN